MQQKEVPEKFQKTETPFCIVNKDNFNDILSEKSDTRMWRYRESS